MNRDCIILYVNNKRCEIRGAMAFCSLTEFLRCEHRLTGTKVVCAEGDCGACTVLVGQLDGDRLRYLTVDACIQFLYQLDCKHVVTVEGLGVGQAASLPARPASSLPHGTPDSLYAAKREVRLHPVQQAMMDCHGSQCGFCTPGFVMALAGMFERQREGHETDVRTALTGNLCRCTGYLPILEAASAVNAGALPDFDPLGDRIADLRRHSVLPVMIETSAARFFAPRTLEDALEFKCRHPQAAIISGGTELGVLRNKAGLEPAALLSLTHIPGLADIVCSDGSAVIGANVTWTQLESFARAALPEFHRLIVRFGSPQIRNVATLVGNVAHGSPIADSLPLLCVLDAELNLVSVRGERRVKINSFYTGYKVKDLAPDEIITHVRMRLPAADELLKLYKVSRRNDLDIATFGAAILVRTVGDIISRAFIAYSGVGPTVIRLSGVENFLQGKPIEERTFREAGQKARREIEPISDVRGSRDYRWQLAENILAKFYFDCFASEGLPV